MGTAAKLSAIDLIGAFSDRFEPGWNAHAGDGILGHSHRLDRKAVNDIQGTDVNNHGLLTGTQNSPETVKLAW